LIPESGQAEVLTLRELAGLSLDRLRFVTLSSCWSADNFVLPGRWVISLPETLWRAGAHSILGSLWEVRDDIAVAFMDRFYRNLDSYPRDQALRLTQLACLEGKIFPGNKLNGELSLENKMAGNPENWAGFNLYGDYRALRF
jgi:CHAT domain-containing protein